jgi:hypothetical protein
VSTKGLSVQNGADNQDWPEPVKREFLKLHFLAREYGFDVVCAVGFNLTRAKAGEAAITAFFSPTASANPHLTEMLTDIAELFTKSAERRKQ